MRDATRQAVIADVLYRNRYRLRHSVDDGEHSTAVFVNVAREASAALDYIEGLLALEADE